MIKKIRTIRMKILVLFAFLFLALLVGMFAFQQMAMNNIYEVTTSFMEETLERMNVEISQKLDDVERISFIVAGESEIQKALRQELPEDEQQLYFERLQFNFQLFYMNQFNQNIYGIYVIGENGVFFRSSQRSPRIVDFREAQWYRTIIQEEETMWMKPHVGSQFVRTLERGMISVGVPIKDRISHEILGVVVCDILIDALMIGEGGDAIFRGEILILDEGRNIIYFENGEDEFQAELEVALGTLESSPDETSRVIRNLSIGNESYLAVEMQLETNNWRLLALISHEEMFEAIDGIRMIMGVTFALFMVLAVFLALLGANQISKPIKDMQVTMKNVETGNFDVEVKINSNDEVGDLGNSFNHMLKEVKHLMEREREHQERLRKAEFRVFQSQINPHFLYNTLDSISWLARMNKSDKIEEMIHSLTTLLRIGVSRGRNYITVGEELQHVRSYIAIMEKRYSSILETEIDVPEEYYPYNILKVILQPLVENAIYHGIKESGKKGKVTISAKVQGDQLIFSVKDTGVGMTEEKLHKIQDMMKQGIDYDPDAYGVINVQKRIQMYFGSEYGLHYESEYMKGTCVTITLPVAFASEEGKVEE